MQTYTNNTCTPQRHGCTQTYTQHIPLEGQLDCAKTATAIWTTSSMAIMSSAKKLQILYNCTVCMYIKKINTKLCIYFHCRLLLQKSYLESNQETYRLLHGVNTTGNSESITIICLLS